MSDKRHDRAEQFVRLDELLAKGDENLTEDEGAEFEELAHLLVDPEYISHRQALVLGGAAAIAGEVDVVL